MALRHFSAQPSGLSAAMATPQTRLAFLERQAARRQKFEPCRVWGANLDHDCCPVALCFLHLADGGREGRFEPVRRHVFEIKSTICHH